MRTLEDVGTRRIVPISILLEPARHLVNLGHVLSMTHVDLDTLKLYAGNGKVEVFVD